MNRTQLFRSTVAILVLLVAVAFAPAGGVKPGNKAPAFKLKATDGKMVSLDDYKNKKGVIVIFSCNHCPFVIKYEDRMKALHKKYEKLGFPVVAINSNDPVKSPDDSYDKMITHAKKKKYNFPYLYDETQAIAKAYGAEKTPHIYLLEKSGNDFTVKYVGAIDDNAGNAKAVKDKYLENAIDALLASKPVPAAETKAIGCTIKWKE